MKYDKPLISATLVKRYKRFLADVIMQNGDEITVHCANTGAMTGCAEPGSKVWLYKSDNLKRKYIFSWELVELCNPSGFICINTARPNQVVEQGLLAKKIPELAEYESVRREVKYGEGSRVDFLLTQENLSDVYLEVKSVTLHLGEDLGAFPDAVTTRGQKHLKELMTIKKSGARAVLLFCVMHSSIQQVTVADHIDPKYAELLEEAVAAGVEVYCYSVEMSEDQLVMKSRLPLVMPKQRLDVLCG